MAFRIVVKGADLTKPPLLDTEDAVAVEIVNPRGELIAILHKMFDSDVWGVTTRDDEDWEAAKATLGYSVGGVDLETKSKKDFFTL